MRKSYADTLARIGRLWNNGASEFFAKLNPDPWVVAHEELEAAFAYPDEKFREVALTMFESKCTELLKIYKRMLQLQQKAPPGPEGIKDCFMKGLSGWEPADVPISEAPLPKHIEEARAEKKVSFFEK